MSERPPLPRALWILARPRMLPYLLGLVLVGYGFTHWDRALPATGLAELPWVLAAWAALHAGTLWLNAALDRDEGEVLLGRAVPVPDGLPLWGYLALLVAVGLAALANSTVALACAVCALLAVLYSHPATVWKGHPLGGPFVNFVGYGLLTPFAGWAVVGVPATPRVGVVWVLGALGVLGCYFLAQAFQEAEDRERGYRTLVATHGAAGVLLAARLCIGAGLLGGVVLALIGWLPRICLLGLGLGFWVDAWFRRWAREPGGGSEAWARGAAHRLLITGLVGLLLAFGEYARASFAGEPVAGLGTAAGHPPDLRILGMVRRTASDRPGVGVE